jgi:KGK domain
VSKQFQPLADGEVVSVKTTCRVSELAAQIRSKVADTLAEWSDEHGVDGEVLRFGSQGWEKGKIRLHLSIEFCPNEGGIQAVAPAQSAHPTSGAVNAPQSIHQTATSATSAVAAATAFTSMAPAAPPLATNHIAEAAAPETATDDQFELGTMSDVSGEINLNLSDEHNGYVDFDLSAAMPDLNLEELVANVQSGRPSLVEEVWSEIEQPNWPGVSRA